MVLDTESDNKRKRHAHLHKWMCVVCVWLCIEDNLGCLSMQADKVEGTRLITGIDGGQYLL